MIGIELDMADESAAKIDPQAAIGTLKDVFANYRRGVCFQPGDLVTPEAWANMRYSGEPHIVLETKEAEPDFTMPEELSDSCSCFFGARRTVRIAWFNGQYARAFWVEAHELKPYHGAE